MNVNLEAANVPVCVAIKPTLKLPSDGNNLTLLNQEKV